MINNNLLVIHCYMKRKKNVSRILRQHLSRIGRKGGKAVAPEAKSTAGKAGMAKRWAHVPRCPECHRPATKEQREAMKAAQHGAAETKIV